MVNISITIDASKFSRWLGQAPQKVAGAITNILTKVSLVVERGAKIKSPVDTGRMRASIATDLRPTMAVIQPHTNYAIFVHEGTRYMRARPFMRDAATDAEREIPGIVDFELSKL
jgi:HK97 gp10 family phage protein